MLLYIAVCYNAANFLQCPRNRHLIARGVCCEFKGSMIVPKLEKHLFLRIQDEKNTTFSTEIADFAVQ